MLRHGRANAQSCSSRESRVTLQSTCANRAGWTFVEPGLHAGLRHALTDEKTPSSRWLQDYFRPTVVARVEVLVGLSRPAQFELV